MTMKSSLPIDVSLLAILFAIHATSTGNKNQNLKMAVLVLLIAHVLFTSKGMYGEQQKPMALGHAINDEIDEIIEEEQEETVVELDIPNESDNVIEPAEIKTVRKSVSNSEFVRNFSVPTESAVLSNPNPVVSDDLNERMAGSRTNFFSDILT